MCRKYEDKEKEKRRLQDAFIRARQHVVEAETRRRERAEAIERARLSVARQNT